MKFARCIGRAPQSAQVAALARGRRPFSTKLHAANAPSHVAGSELPFAELKQKPMTHTTHLGRHRAINLAAGAAALPLEVLERAASSFVETDHSGMSVAEMGYRTKPFHRIMERAETSLRNFLSIPDSHEVHFFNGGATLQFAAIPLNLLGGQNEGKKANYLMSGHWSEKARNEASLFGEVHEVAVDPQGLYFEIPSSKTWEIDQNAAYFHYTSADTRQGLEIRDFDFDAIPSGMPVCCDASANLGSAPIDVSKYGVLYAASHKNFSTAGVCYSIIRKDLISKETQMKAIPTMCNWNTFQSAPNKIYNVPVLMSVWIGALNTEWMIERGGVEAFQELAITRSGLLYDLIDNSGGFYNTFVNNEACAFLKDPERYDIYARVCMLLGFSSFVQSLSFYANGHIVVELRGFYVAHATAFVLEVLHVLLLRFDIIQGRVKSTDRTPAWFLWLGPAAVLFATVGMSLDFHVHFSFVVVIFTWICIFAAYICQFCYQLRILEVILPDDIRNPLKMEESIGDAWWPSAWRCPSAFAHVLYFVAPPARLQPGQFDLMREVKEGPQGNAFETAGVPLMETKPADTSEANPGMSAEEIAMQVQYLDRLFDYFQSDQVDATLSETNKERVKELYGEFANARRKGSGPEAMRVFQDSLMALEGIMAAEGMRHEGGDHEGGGGHSGLHFSREGVRRLSGALMGVLWEPKTATDSKRSYGLMPRAFRSALAETSSF
ncbi:Phosphoserine aminotransferase (Phosphohydroxythreonine aminotransferase) (PSAT), partial [Durusdinium trenchii]